MMRKYISSVIINHSKEIIIMNIYNNPELMRRLQKDIPLRDNYRREQEYQKQKNRIVQYQIGEKVKHPKFGEGSVENIQQMEGSVRLHVRFKDEMKVLDQKWLLKTKYQSASKSNRIS